MENLEKLKQIFKKVKLVKGFRVIRHPDFSRFENNNINTLQLYIEAFRKKTNKFSDLVFEFEMKKEETIKDIFLELIQDIYIGVMTKDKHLIDRYKIKDKIYSKEDLINKLEEL